MNVLVVSSQPDFLSVGLEVLAQNDLVPHFQNTVENARAASQALAPSLVILDADSASGDLAGTCQTLHDASQAPIIVVTREALSEFEAAACFDAGAGARPGRLSPTSPESACGLVTIGLDDWPPEELVTTLQERFSIVARTVHGPDGVRFSTHFFNTPSEVEKVTEILERLATEGHRPS